MSDDPKFHAAIAQEIVWKYPEMQRFAVALVTHALSHALGDIPSPAGAGEGQGEGCGVSKKSYGRGEGGTFTTDIVPDELRGTGTGIAGSVVNTLKAAHVIEAVGIMAGGIFYPEKVISTRSGRNSSPIGVYRLVSPAIAREFLRRHGSAPAESPQQPEFGLALPRPIGAMAN